MTLCPFHNPNSQKKYTDILEELSFGVLNKIGNIDFGLYLEEMRLHHDKDIIFLNLLLSKIVKDIIEELNLTSKIEEIIKKNIGTIHESLDIHLINLFTIALLDIVSIISVCKNLNKNKTYGIKILLMNMDGGTVEFRNTISETVNKLVGLNEIDQLEIKIEEISKLNQGKKACHFIMSDKKHDWLNSAWDILEEKVFGTFKKYDNYIDEKWDKTGNFHFRSGKII